MLMKKLAKAELVLKINQIIKHKKLKQVDAAKLLGVDQSKISLLSCGRLSDFSIERLVKYLNLLDQDVEIVIKKTKKKKYTTRDFACYLCLKLRSHSFLTTSMKTYNH